jgi:glyoxalase family protein
MLAEAQGKTLGIISAEYGYRELSSKEAKVGEGRTAMKLEGIHHVTAITADAPQNVDFYTRVLGLRLVKKTVNQDDPTVYHLFYADEKGSAGSDITFFEYPGLPRGRTGAGMVHTVSFRVASEEALSFWINRLGNEGVNSELDGFRLRLADPEGMGLELHAVETDDEPLVANHPEIPAELALQGFDGVRAYTTDSDASRPFLEETLAFEANGDGAWEARGDDRGSIYSYDEPPVDRGLSGAGTVHHVAWASPLDEHDAWRERVAQAGARPTPVIDRFYFRSVYFREPSGVLFEIATLGPGFTADEPLETLGEALSLPPAFEPLRERLEHVLTPLPEPRRARTAR